MKVLCRITLLLVCSFVSIMLVGCNTTYNCPNTGHCYGEVKFPTPGLQGMITTVDVDHMVDTGDGFVDNEMWIVDRNNAACAAQKNICWVETGYVADNNAITGDGGSASGIDLHFFWADNRPNSTFIYHDFGLVPDYYFGHKVTFLIMKAGTNRWTVNIQPVSIPGASTWSGTSTNNAMAPQSAEMGQELAGTKGATANPVNYTGTGIKSSTPTSVTVTGTTFTQILTVSTDGDVTNANPPTGTWITPPSAANANGGRFQTHCCS
jgi:hypothetical protein